MTPEAALDHIWQVAGGDPKSLGHVMLTGMEPVLPSSFKVGTIAQSTIAAAALAAAELHRSKTGRTQSVAVDMRHAAIEFRSERVYEIDGKAAPSVWDKIAGTYRTGDGRWVRLHTNFPHHREGVLKLLDATYARESVAAAVMQWKGQDLEDAAAERGLVVTMMRSAAEWTTHAQGQALSRLPLFEITRIGEAPPEPLPRGARPLANVRVLDLTRILAGPICARTLAVHGADVLRVTGPHLPGVDILDRDTGRGKLSTQIDISHPVGRETLSSLLATADILVQSYRPGGIAARGFAPEACAAKRPGLVYVSLSAYGHAGPWAQRRGFDSLVQTASGINHAEAEAASVEHPQELPCQALDHGAGYLMAAGAMLALKRRAEIGGSWLVRLSLAQVGRWLTSLGRVPDGHSMRDPQREDILDLLEGSASGFGRMSALRHAARLSETPAYWERPSVPLGSHRPLWPARTAQ